MARGITSSRDILADENRDKREEIVELLERAYWMEIETVMSYIANSVNPDGVRAQEIKESLAQDVDGGARPRASCSRERIKELYGVVPGSEEFQRRAVLPAAAGRPDRHRRT